jgi:Spy/CpxP family protein refolding chaperone
MRPALKITEKQRQKMRDLRRAGETYKAIAAVVGVNMTKVYRLTSHIEPSAGGGAHRRG